jgi:ATP-dependent Clp protease protease subunit
MGAMLLTAGTKGKRFALPNSRIMIHQPMGGAGGQATDVMITVNEIKKLKLELYTIISEHSGQSVEKIAADSERDYWMTSEESKAYGLIDDVLFRHHIKKDE